MSALDVRRSPPAARGPRTSLLAALGVSMLGAAPARAELCGANGNPVVYVTGSSAAAPFLAALGRVLYTDPHPLTIVYKSVGSCAGVSAVLNGDPLGGTAVYWDPASSNPNNAVPCTIPTSAVTGTVTTDLGVSDVFASTCASLPGGLPSSVGDFFGPVQTTAFIVPKASNERAISAEAAYFVFGFGSESGVGPWTDAAAIFRRNAQSGTQNMIAQAIGVPVQKFKGQDAGSSSAMIAKVLSAPNPQQAIGIIAQTEIDDAASVDVNVLAYQHYNQRCGYTPDSAPGARDKRNVRDGHYVLWGPLHFFTRVDGSGYPSSPGAKHLLSYITGTLPAPGGVDLIQVEAVNNLVPTCAMRVHRDSEVGPLSPWTPISPCGCYFDQVATGHSACAICSKNSDCPEAAPVCSFGFCEAESLSGLMGTGTLPAQGSARPSLH